jgi:nucleoside phosphorylase
MAANLRSLRFDEYSVGWISPLPIPEQAASRAMLDEIHEDPTGDNSTENDNNAYTVGSIGKFNVVIAGLPAGKQGSGAAARVAKDMVRSYRNIKIMLLVGIGGGVPGLKLEGVDGDIRLGDVVVCQQSKNSDAVIQYDYGKSIQGGKFEVSEGSLDKPPEAALAAVGKLMAKHAVEGNNIAYHILKMIERYPRLATYTCPDVQMDRPFKPHYFHQTRGESCDTCCTFDKANLLSREDRKDSLPRVHYGTMGSANQVVKDSILRDKWAKDEGIICFEMEAAGE